MPSHGSWMGRVGDPLGLQGREAGPARRLSVRRMFAQDRWTTATGWRCRLFALVVLAGCLGATIAGRSGRSDRVASDRLDGARFLADFSLRNSRGDAVTMKDWRFFRLVVLIPTPSRDLNTAKFDPAIRSHASAYRSRGVGFYAVCVDPSVGVDRTESSIDATQFGLPILFDPAQELVDAAGIRSMADVAVVDPGGLVLFRGPIGRLETILNCVLAGKPPVLEYSDTPGEPLPEPAPLIAAGVSVTYSRDVAPILRAHCVGCHRPGEVGPFSLATYRDVAKRARFVRDVTGSGQMPPWRAQPGYGEFLDAHRLTRRELALIDRWAESGAPEGDRSDLVAASPSPDAWQLGLPDVVLTMAEPYDVPAVGDDWRGFVLPGPLVDGRAIAAVEYRPGNRKVAHHARVFVDDTPYSRRLDAETPGPGFGYDGRFDIPRPALAEWAPGMRLRRPPEGVAKPVRPGSDVVLLLHYHGTGKPEKDLSRVGIYYAKAAPRRIMAMQTLSSDRIDIPAGAAQHREVARSTLRHDVHAYSVFPHGHNLLRELKFTATLPDGQVRRMLWIKDWDFGWQSQYYYAEPIALPRGTKLEVVALYDNSSANPRNPNSPPARVKYGPSSREEMLGCHLYVVADDADGDTYYRAKWESAR